jgi:hypothetical protein
MTQRAQKWTRNTQGLHAHAQNKAEQTRRRAEEALACLLKQQRPINFKAVAETAGISTAWLYGQQDIKMRIIHLRSQQVPQTQAKIPMREQASDASKDAVMVALRKRAKDQETEIRELRRQLEVAYGQLYRQS